MARYKSELGDVKLGTYAVAHIKDVTYVTPDQTEILADEAHADDAEVVDLATRGVYALEINVNLDDTDTNGQVALESAYASRSTVTATYAAQGFVTGNVTKTGACYVTKVPNRGGQGKNTIASGVYRLVFKAKPTAGVAA
jgi:hypothetical protein